MCTFHSFLAYFILFLSLNSFAAHYDPNPEAAADYQYRAPRIQGNLDNFADEDVIVIYRGIHFLPDNFDDAERLAFIQDSQVSEPMYAPAAYAQAGKEYGSKDYRLLNFYGIQISEIVNALDNSDVCVVNGQVFGCARYPFQQLYSNNAKMFFRELAHPSGDYSVVFDGMDFTSNPLLSGSDKARHPAKYGFGLKNYGDHQPLLPLYNISGLPQHSIVGKLYGIVLDAAAVEQLKPLNVAQAHDCEYFKIHDHYSNDILSEREISIAGYIPAECVVFEMPLQVPSFVGDYPHYYERKYGLSKKRFNNFKRAFTSAATTPAERLQKSREVMETIIKAKREDDKLIYKNCIDERIPTMFEEELDQIDARIGTLNLDYEID